MPTQAGLFDETAEQPDRSAPTTLDVALVDLHRRTEAGDPGGPRFGDLVHALLAAVPFDADRAGIENIAAVQGRIVSAAAEEISAAAATIERVLAHDLLVRARAADQHGACRRETPVTCTVDSGDVVEGIVDLAFEEDGAWTVVDYKTYRELSAEGAEQYRRQVALYAHAIARATGKPARGVLVRL